MSFFQQCLYRRDCPISKFFKDCVGAAREAFRAINVIKKRRKKDFDF